MLLEDFPAISLREKSCLIREGGSRHCPRVPAPRLAGAHVVDEAIRIRYIPASKGGGARRRPFQVRAAFQRRVAERSRPCRADLKRLHTLSVLLLLLLPFSVRSESPVISAGFSRPLNSLSSSLFLPLSVSCERKQTFPFGNLTGKSGLHNSSFSREDERRNERKVSSSHSDRGGPDPDPDHSGLVSGISAGTSH